MNNTIKFSVDENNNNKRLDVFLADNINEFTRSFLKKLIEDKQVRLNNIAISSPSIKVKYQDQITIKIIKYCAGSFNWIERRISAPEVMGSTPIRRTI